LKKQKSICCINENLTRRYLKVNPRNLGLGCDIPNSEESHPTRDQKAGRTVKTFLSNRTKPGTFSGHEGLERDDHFGAADG
jgi:hypothetical protein